MENPNINGNTFQVFRSENEATWCLLHGTYPVRILLGGAGAKRYFFAGSMPISIPQCW